jgi:hypothetical protein
MKGDRERELLRRAAQAALDWEREHGPTPPPRDGLYWDDDRVVDLTGAEVLDDDDEIEDDEEGQEEDDAE